MKKLFFIALIAISILAGVTSCNSSSSPKNLSATVTDSSMIYSCSMHQEVISDHPGECPKCGMTLVKQKITAMQKKLVDEGNYVKVKN